MAEILESSIQQLLRSSEELKLILEAEATSPPTENEPSSSSSSSTSESSTSDSETDSDTDIPGVYSRRHLRKASRHKQRVLAIVTHVDPYGEEQGW